MVTQVSYGALTSVEQSLVEHVGHGEWLDLAADDEVIDEAAMRSWGDSRTCRACVIRDILRGRLAADPDPHGLRLRAARIVGQLDLANLTTNVNLALKDCYLEEGLLARNAHLPDFDLTGCHLEHPTEPSLDAERLTCGTLCLDEATIIGHSEVGAVNLSGGHIGGQLSCRGANLHNRSGPALKADGLRVDRGMFLHGGFTAIGAGADGAVNLVGAYIGGQVDCTGASLGNDSGPALNANVVQVDQVLILIGGFTATGAGPDGAVHLAGARIGGQLWCEGASLRNDSGPALHANSLRVDGAMFLRGGFTATGAGESGVVWLTGAHIGQLWCDGASLHNESGPALNASSLQVDQAIFLIGGFTATGAGADGAVTLTSAHIGQLWCDGASVRNDSGPALNASSMQVDQAMLLRGGFIAAGAGVAVDLTAVRVGGTLEFDPERLEHATDPGRRLAVNGLTYAGVPKPISARGWLSLLREGTPGYAAQPYQQLAAGYRALGDDQQDRGILMAQRDDQLARTHPRWPERLWGRITRVTLGYGYQPWRALLFLVGVVALSCVLAVVLGSHGALAQTSNTATPGRSCTVIQQASVGLDLNLPIGKSVARDHCDVAKDSASVTAAWLTAADWVLQLLAWVFAALFIAGFTSAVRRT